MISTKQIWKKPADKRYQYFLRTVIDEEEVFGLADAEGWALLGDENDSDILPVFPLREFAEDFRHKADFTEYQVEAIDLNEFVAWLEDMEKESMLIAIFPRPDMESVVYSAERLRNEIIEEFGKEMED